MTGLPEVLPRLWDGEDRLRPESNTRHVVLQRGFRSRDAVSLSAADLGALRLFPEVVEIVSITGW